MRVVSRLFRWFGIALGVLIVALLAAFGLLQTQPGKSWLERTIVQSVTSPGFAVTMQGLDGFVPFRLKVERIDIADRDGTYLTVRDFGLDISPAALLAGRIHGLPERVGVVLSGGNVGLERFRELLGNS